MQADHLVKAQFCSPGRRRRVGLLDKAQFSIQHAHAWVCCKCKSASDRRHLGRCACRAHGLSGSARCKAQRGCSSGPIRSAPALARCAMLYAPAEPVLSGTLYRPLRELVLTGTSSGATTVTRGECTCYLTPCQRAGPGCKSIGVPLATSVEQLYMNQAFRT